MQTLAAYNPLAVAVEGLRDALLGGTGWAGVKEDVLKLVPMSILALVVGSLLFRLAMRREQRRGTLGLY